MPAWSWWAPIRCGSSPRVRVRRGRARSRSRHRPASCRSGRTRRCRRARARGWRGPGLAVLQALDQRAGGQAEHVLVERELHRRRALVLSGRRRRPSYRSAPKRRRAISSQVGEPAPAPLLRVLLEEKLERGQEADDLLLAALRRAPDAACRQPAPACACRTGSPAGSTARNRCHDRAAGAPPIG